MISEHSDHDALVARIAAIDARPLEDRAGAFAELNDELRERLDGASETDATNAGPA